MLVLVAVGAQVFPVAAVGRVVVVVAVLVVDGQQVQVGLAEFPAALGADRAVDSDGFHAVVAVVLNLAPHALDERGRLRGAGEGDGLRASWSHVVFPFYPVLFLSKILAPIF